MSSAEILGIFQLGFIYGLMALGIFISFRILNIPDLTVDGSFTFGCAVSAMVAVKGYPLLGIFLAFAAGCLAGTITALLNTKLKIQPILAGIITMTGLYSINLRVMSKKATLSIDEEHNVFTLVGKFLSKTFPNLDAMVINNITRLVIPFFVVTLTVILLHIFFKTQLGLSLRATGDNEDMVRSSSIDSDFTKIFGIALSNGIVALAGGILAQYQGFSDINLGTGMIVMGLACLIIGEVVFGKFTMLWRFIAIVFGAIVYRFIMAFVLKIGLEVSDIKLISAIIIAIAISFPTIKKKIQFAINRKGGARKC